MWAEIDYERSVASRKLIFQESRLSQFDVGFTVGGLYFIGLALVVSIYASIQFVQEKKFFELLVFNAIIGGIIWFLYVAFFMQKKLTRIKGMSENANRKAIAKVCEKMDLEIDLQEDCDRIIYLFPDGGNNHSRLVLLLDGENVWANCMSYRIRPGDVITPIFSLSNDELIRKFKKELDAHSEFKNFS